MSFCWNCGKDLKAGSGFCPSCGSVTRTESLSLSGSERLCANCKTPNSASAGFCRSCGLSLAAPVAREPIAAFPSWQQVVSESEMRKRRRRMVLLILLLSIVGAGGLGAGAYFAFGKQQPRSMLPQLEPPELHSVQPAVIDSTETIAGSMSEPTPEYEPEDVPVKPAVSKPSFTTCNNCVGLGQVLSSTDCVICSGTGLNTCSICGGDKLRPCTTCHGDQTIACSTCKGSGSATGQCVSCGGQGYKTVRIIGDEGVAGSSNEACTICSGTGKGVCPACSGNREVPCVTCRASGQIACTICDSNGRTACGRCEGSGRDQIKSICTKCKGSGVITVSN